jgi:hypothetical protein
MRRRKVRPVWFGWMNDSKAIYELASWVKKGGPGRAELPEVLKLTTFRPANRNKRAG